MSMENNPKSLRDQDGMWEYFQTDGSSIFDFAVPRLAYLFRQARAFSKHQPISVLNIGIGNAWLEGKCQKQGWLTVALDPVFAAAKTTGEKGITAIQADIAALPFADASFDVVFCSEVLEHLNDNLLPLGIGEISRVLKPNAVLIGTVPFEEPLENRITVCPECHHVHHTYGHHQSFSKQRLKVLFEAARFGDIDFRTRSFPGFLRRNFLGKLKSLVWVVVGRIGAQAADSKIVFLAKRL